jgi:hypothetical protein
MLDEEVMRIAKFLKMPAAKFRAEFLDGMEIFHTELFKIKSKKAEGKHYGPCAFLEGGICRIQEVKPLHCRVCNCKEGDDLHVWFMVNHLLKADDPESVRQYVSYVKTCGRMIPGAEVKTLFPDAKRLKDIVDYKIMR